MKNLVSWPKLQSLKGGDFFLQEKVTANIKLHSDPEEGHSEASLPLSLSQNSANISDALNLICNLLPL